MIVVDTNVLAYLLIKGDKTEDAQALYSQDDDWHTEPFALVELSNLLTTACRSGGLAFSRASRVLATAEQVLQGRTHAVSHQMALAVAKEFAVSAYDARFITVADQLGAALVTEDQRLRKAAPSRTTSIADVLTERR